jgi:hypothetical protein
MENAGSRLNEVRCSLLIVFGPSVVALQNGYSSSFSAINLIEFATLERMIAVGKPQQIQIEWFAHRTVRGAKIPLYFSLFRKGSQKTHCGCN